MIYNILLKLYNNKIYDLCYIVVMLYIMLYNVI